MHKENLKSLWKDEKMLTRQEERVLAQKAPAVYDVGFQH